MPTWLTVNAHAAHFDKLVPSGASNITTHKDYNQTALELRETRKRSDTLDSFINDDIACQILMGSSTMAINAPETTEAANPDPTETVTDNQEEANVWWDTQEVDDLSPEAILDPKIRSLGKLLADIHNLQAAAVRNKDYLDAGYPVILPLAGRFQSPGPIPDDDELVSSLNDAMHECGINLSNILIEWQIKKLGELRKKRQEIRLVFSPNAKQRNEIDAVKRSHMNEIRPFPDPPRIEGPLQYFLKPNKALKERCIVPNLALRNIRSTGFRNPREQTIRQQQRPTPDDNNFQQHQNGYRQQRNHSKNGQNNFNQTYNGHRNENNSGDGGQQQKSYGPRAFYSKPPRRNWREQKAKPKMEDEPSIPLDYVKRTC